MLKNLTDPEPYLLNSPIDLIQRPRRNRKSPAVRNLFQETRLHASQLVAPLFILEGTQCKDPINSMPGIYRYTIDLLVEEVKQLYDLGIQAIDLFPVIPTDKKTEDGLEALNPQNLVCTAIRAIKAAVPDMCIMADVALDPYTTHGHDGLLNNRQDVDNDKTLRALALMSLILADAGVDVIAPSDMMDGRVGYIRRTLDTYHHQEVSILAYTAKYASSFYGPFRDALSSAPKSGNKKTYQMNPANRKEACLEAQLDLQEGADMLLVKPALAYLDVIYELKSLSNVPIGAYHVSGEYSMIMAAAQRGWIDAEAAIEECLLSIKRAGADFTLTYAAKAFAKKLYERNF